MVSPNFKYFAQSYLQTYNLIRSRDVSRLVGFGGFPNPGGHPVASRVYDVTPHARTRAPLSPAKTWTCLERVFLDIGPLFT